MLGVLAQHAPAGLREGQWAVLAKLKRSGGTWSTYKSRLRTRGHICQEGDLWCATETGIEAAGIVPEMPQTTEGILEMWRHKPGMRLVEAALEHGPLDLDELAIAVGLEATGGTFSTYLSRAKTGADDCDMLRPCHVDEAARYVAAVRRRPLRGRVLPIHHGLCRGPGAGGRALRGAQPMSLTLYQEIRRLDAMAEGTRSLFRRHSEHARKRLDDFAAYMILVDAAGATFMEFDE